MLLRILPASTHCPIPKPLPRFNVLVTAAYHFQVSKSVLLPETAVTNYQELNSLKRQKFILTLLRVKSSKRFSLGWNQGIDRAGSSRKSWRRSHLLFCSQRCSSIHGHSTPIITYPLMMPTLLPVAYKDHNDYSGPTWMTQAISPPQDP